MERKRKHGFPVLLSILLTQIIACGSNESSEQTSLKSDSSNGKRILRVAYEREIDLLNPLTSQNLCDISFGIIEGLITTNEQNTYIPVLAKTIPSEENGLIKRNEDGTVDMTWPLHENVYWHDGEPFTSDDVYFTWKFVISENSVVYNRDQYLGIKDCIIMDDHTFIFRWDGEYAYYNGLFEAILPEHILGGMTTEEIVNYEPFNRGSQTIGTGPFKFAEWKTGEYIRVVRNDNYWRGPGYPKIDEIVWSFIPDNNTRLNALKTGRYDYGRIEARQVKEVKKLTDYTIYLIESNMVMHFDVNVKTDKGRMLFSEANVRKAMYHAIDRKAIAEQLMEGTVTIANTPVNPNSPYHNPNVKGYAFDPDLSRQLLNEAGWLVGSDGIRVKDGIRFSFSMINRAGVADRIAIAQVIQAQLKNVGIEITFETLESAAWTQRWRNGQWEGIVSAWFLPADPSITNLYASDGSNNMTGLYDPSLDEVMKQSDTALAFHKRKPYMDKAQQLLAKTALTLPIYFNVVPELVHTRVGNFKGSGANFGSFWNVYEWTIEK